MINDSNGCHFVSGDGTPRNYGCRKTCFAGRAIAIIGIASASGNTIPNALHLEPRTCLAGERNNTPRKQGPYRILAKRLHRQKRRGSQPPSTVIFMGLIQSAKLNGHDPHPYLKDALPRAPTNPARHPT
jgi:hypothetical protein